MKLIDETTTEDTKMRILSDVRQILLEMGSAAVKLDYNASSRMCLVGSMAIGFILDPASPMERLPKSDAEREFVERLPKGFISLDYREADTEWWRGFWSGYISLCTGVVIGTAAAYSMIHFW